MSKWLALARSEIQDLTRVPNVPKSPKYLPNGNFGTFGNFGTRAEDSTPHESQPRGINSAADMDEAEREAIAIELGGAPEIYASEFARLQARPPAEVPRDRWHQFINDAGLFLDRWGRQAEAFGWRADELFGLHPDAPMARYDRMGLIWMLRGETVLDISETAARLSGGLAIYRKATA
jgi:hypothetical protein